MQKVHSEVTSLMDRFCEIEVALVEELEEKGVIAADVRRHISILPLPLLKDMYLYIEPEADKLEEKKTLTGLLSFLSVRVWNFIDYHLLEHVVMKFGSESLQDNMKLYMRELEWFESQTTVHALIECWPTGQDFKPPKYEDDAVMVNIDPKSCTVKELNEIRRNLCVKFLPPLSELAHNLVMFHRKGFK